MPYTKRKFSRRSRVSTTSGGRYKKRSNRSHKTYSSTSKSTGLSVAAKALKLANYLRGLINVEFKYKDLTHSDLNGAIGIKPVAANKLCLNALGQGDLYDQRNGNQVLFKTMKTAFQINADTGVNASTIQRVKVLVINEPASNGAALDLAWFYNDTSLYETPRNLDYVKSYNTLYSKEFILHKTERPTVNVHINRKLNFHTKYNGNAGTYADITSGALWLVVFTDQAAYVPTLNTFTNRIYYIDN